MSRSPSLTKCVVPMANQPPDNDPLAGMTAKRIWFDCIWLSEERTAVKLMLLCIGRFFDDNAQSSSMSYTQVARECSLTDRGAKKIAGEVRDRWLRIEVNAGYHVPGKGRTNRYSGIAPNALVEKLRDRERTKSGVNHIHPDPDFDVNHVHPEAERGERNDIAGCSQFTRTQNNSDSKLVVDGAIRFEVSDSELETFNGICSAWRKEPDLVAKRIDRSKTDEAFFKAIAPYGTTDPDILQIAVSNAMLALDGACENANSNNWRSAVNWFSRALPSKITDAQLDQAKAQARARSEKEIQTELHNQRRAGLNGSGRRKSRERPSMDDILQQAFRTDEHD